MCLAPSSCSLDLDFFDESTTASNFAQIQNQYLLPISLRICLSELAMQDIVNADQKVHRSGGMKVLRSINTCLLQFH